MTLPYTRNTKEAEGEARPAKKNGEVPEHVTVYGNDHSPWVQAVLLGLHDAKIPYTLVTAPPLKTLLSAGVLMPAVRFDDSAWRYDSGDVLKSLGYGAVSEVRTRLLSDLFMRAAYTRLDRRWMFWYRFSFSRDGDPVWWRRARNNFARALPVFYFFMLISLGRFRIAAPDQKTFVDAFEALQNTLPKDKPFFGGDAPDTFDFQAFGVVQMIETMPSLPHEVLCQHPTLGRLRGWISVMQERFADYDRLYTAQRFEPKSPARSVATPFERTCYWCGAAMCWLALPFTVPFVLYSSARIRRNGLVGSLDRS